MLGELIDILFNAVRAVKGCVSSHRQRISSFYKIIFYIPFILFMLANIFIIFYADFATAYRPQIVKTNNSELVTGGIDKAIDKSI